MADIRIAGGALNVDGMQTAHVHLIHRDPTLKGIVLWTFEDVFVLYIRVAEAISEVLSTTISKEILAGRYLRGEVFGLAIKPGPVRHEFLLVEGVSLVEGELVVVNRMLILLSISPV